MERLCQTRTKDEWFSEVAKDSPLTPFNQKFHLIFNAAVDGRIFEKTKQKADLIDYIRVYQWAESSRSSGSCPIIDPINLTSQIINT